MPGPGYPDPAKNVRGQVQARRVAPGSFPLLFAALTGRSGHGLAPYGPRCPAYPLGL